MIASALAVRPPSRAPARPQTGVLRRCGRGVPAQGGECAECGRKRLQRSGSAAGPAAAPSIVHDVLRSPGQPLDAATRAAMEPRFGHSFANVRVHADGQAAESAAAVGAQAYAVGRDIVFGAGKHAPRTEGGRRLLAHELAHVVQQSGSAAPSMHASLEVGPTDAPEERQADAAADAVLRGDAAPVLDGGGPAALRRTPGQNGQESWYEVVDRVEVRIAEKETAETAGRATRASEAVSRMLQTAEGAKLANDLFAAFCKKGKCGTRITVIFADTIPGNEAGIFQPDSAGAGHYTVWIKNVFPPSPGVRQLPGGCWPGPKAPEQVCYSYGDPETGMAATLQHETMHVWFINTQTGRWDTGHGDVEKGQIEPVFLARLKAMAADLDALEKKIHAEQAAKQQQQAPPPVREVPLRERDIERDAPPRRRFLGGEASLQLGGAGGGGIKSFSGILGADLILGDIASLRLGARGVYLTPGHLLAGGTVGTRLLETGGDGGKVDQPLFFDVEAGVLGELAPADAGRFTDRVAGFASVGVGKEYGQAGARFFWRVGGFVMVSDRAFGDLPAGEAKPVAGGGTFGVGARF